MSFEKLCIEIFSEWLQVHPTMSRTKNDSVLNLQLSVPG